MGLYKPCAMDVEHLFRKPAACVEVGGGDARARSLLFRGSWRHDQGGRSAEQAERVDGESGATFVARRDLSRGTTDGREGVAARTAERRARRLAAGGNGIVRARFRDRERRAEKNDLIDVGARFSREPDHHLVVRTERGLLV